MDLALNNLQRLICHKAKTNKQTTNETNKQGSIFLTYICLTTLFSLKIKLHSKGSSSYTPWHTRLDFHMLRTLNEIWGSLKNLDKKWFIFYTNVNNHQVTTTKLSCNILTSDPAGLSDEKYTCVNNRFSQSKISGDNLDCRRVELSTNVTLARSRWMSNYYITLVTGSSDQLERWCWNENHVPAEAGHRSPVEQPRRTGKKCCYGQKSGGQYVAVLFSLQLTSHTIIPFVTLSNPFE